MTNSITFSIKFLRTLIIGAYIIIGLGLFLGDRFFLFDLFSHFYFLYSAIGIVIVIISIFYEDFFSVFASAILLSFLIFHLTKADVFIEDYTGEADIFYLNSNYFVDDPENILREIQKYKAKYIVIVEINEDLHKLLKSEYKNFEYHSERALSMGFYTNEEIITSQVHELIYPVLEIETKYFSTLVIHPLPPFNNELSQKQQKNFQEIQELFGNMQAEKKMIIGDFNSTYFSKIFKTYFGKLHYHPVYSRGAGTPLKIPIDYTLGNTQFFNVHSTNFNVSDHLPLLIDLYE